MSLEEAQVQQGQILAGKYQVEGLLGQGGMGVVLAARHVHLGERVALKLMRQEAVAIPDAVSRFVREARAAARLQSAHVARVSDVGILEDHRPYMVMEYLAGADLEELLRKSGPLPIQDTVDYVLQASEAIAEAHLLGIVHRDLKPSNLFLTQRRDRTVHVKVLDFGISKVVEPGPNGWDAQTTTSSLMGSPLYMSPEQMMGATVDGRSDIWSLGVIMYELLAGVPPFVAETLPQVCSLVLQSEAPSLRARRADAPVELEAVVSRCLAKSPHDRFPAIADLAVALAPLSGPSGQASLARILALRGDSAPALSTSTPPSSAKVPVERRARSAVLSLLGLSALLLGGSAVWWAKQSRNPVASSVAAPELPARSVGSSPSTPPSPTATSLLAAEPAAPMVPSAVVVSTSGVTKRAAAPKVVPRPTAPASAAEKKPDRFGGRL